MLEAAFCQQNPTRLAVVTVGVQCQTRFSSHSGINDSCRSTLSPHSMSSSNLGVGLALAHASIAQPGTQAALPTARPIHQQILGWAAAVALWGPHRPSLDAISACIALVWQTAPCAYTWQFSMYISRRPQTAPPPANTCGAPLSITLSPHVDAGLRVRCGFPACSTVSPSRGVTPTSSSSSCASSHPHDLSCDATQHPPHSQLSPSLHPPTLHSAQL